MRFLIAGVGNILRGDDGFGVRTADRLAAMDLGPDVRVVETGIGGIHLVQELMDPVDVLIVLDASDQGRAPGTVMVIEPEVADVHDMPLIQRYDFLADMHFANPERAFVLARALSVLPATFLLVGCQPLETEHMFIGLSHPVEAAVEVAITEVQRLVTELRAASAAAG